MLADRMLEWLALARNRVDGYACPLHLLPCGCGSTEPDAKRFEELELSKGDVQVAEEILPTLKRLWRDTRKEANRLTGGRGERVHRRRLRKDSVRFRMPWLHPVRRHGRLQGRRRCRGHRRVVSRSAGGGGSGDPPAESDSSEPAAARQPAGLSNAVARP